MEMGSLEDVGMRTRIRTFFKKNRNLLLNGGCASLGSRFLRRLTGEVQVELRSWRLAGQIREARFKGVEWTRPV